MHRLQARLVRSDVGVRILADREIEPKGKTHEYHQDNRSCRQVVGEF